MKSPCIYAIRNNVTGKYYVGQTCSFRKRVARHFNDLSNNKHHCSHLQRSFNKYGQLCFEIVVLEICSQSDLTECEQKWMDAFRSKPGLYNTAPAAASLVGVKRTAEHAAKIAAALRGRKHTPERIAKTTAASRGRVPTETARRNMSSAAKGKPKSDEHRARISAALRGKSKSPEHKAMLSQAAKRRAQCLL